MTILKSNNLCEKAKNAINDGVLLLKDTNEIIFSGASNADE